jgi:integrase/transposase-like protein
MRLKRGNIKRSKTDGIAKPSGRAPKEIGLVKLREIPRPNKEAPAYWEIQLQWRDPKTGKRCYDSAANWPHAEALARKLDKDLSDGIVVSDSVTVGKAMKHWLAHLEERHRSNDKMAGHTLQNIRWGAKHILKEFEHKKVAKITSADVHDWILRVSRMHVGDTARPLSRHNVDNFKGYFFQFLSYCQRQKWIPSNPLREDPVKTPGKRKRRELFASLEDIENLIQILHGPCPLWWHQQAWENAKIQFALRAFAGLRGAEVAALQWEAIDTSKMTLYVKDENGSVGQREISPGKYTQILKEPKSAAGVRQIPINQYLFDALQEHGQATSFDGFVIKKLWRERPDAGSNSFVSTDSVASYHRKLMKQAAMLREPEDAQKLPPGNRNMGGKQIKFSAHDLRHWYASMCLQLGHTTVSVAKRLGHYDASVTTSTYAHVIEKMEDHKPEDVPQIWHYRFQRARTDQPAVVEGGPLLIESHIEVGDSTPIPDTALPWVAEAVRLLEGGWRISDVARHLGNHSTTIHREFRRRGMPTPQEIRRTWRDRRFKEMYDQGYTDREIALKMNCHHVTVIAWRRTYECDRPNTTKSLNELRKQKKVMGAETAEMRQSQLKLL